MLLEEDLKALPEQPDVTPRTKTAPPSASDPGVLSWDGEKGTLMTPVIAGETPQSWDAYLTDAGLDPAEVEVIEPVGIRAWDALQKNEDGIGSSVVRMHYYALKVQTRRTGASIDELIKVIEDRKFTAPKNDDVIDPTFVIAVGDLQIGKMDGDGVEGTLERVNASFDLAMKNYERLVEENDGHAIPIHLAWLGDCIEGFVSQGGANTWRTVLPVGEQIRILRRLMTDAVDRFAPVCPEMTNVAVPGNHDQGSRLMGKGTTFGDSFDIECLLATADAVKRSDSFAHVKFFVPERDSQTISLEMSDGTVIGHAHGHQFNKGKHIEWWKGQAFSDQPVGNADVLLTGHLHHLLIEQTSQRTFIRVPAMESESTWYKLRTGEVGNPGMVTFITLGGKIARIGVV